MEFLKTFIHDKFITHLVEFFARKDRDDDNSEMNDENLRPTKFADKKPDADNDTDEDARPDHGPFLPLELTTQPFTAKMVMHPVHGPVMHATFPDGSTALLANEPMHPTLGHRYHEYTPAPE